MSEHAEATVRDKPEQSRYEALVEADGQQSVAGFAVYVRDGDLVTFLHTEVGEAYAGHGIGTTIIRESLADLRTKGLTVVPQCPFYKKFFEEHLEYGDLLG